MCIESLIKKLIKENSFHEAVFFVCSRNKLDLLQQLNFTFGRLKMSFIIRFMSFGKPFFFEFSYPYIYRK